MQLPLAIPTGGIYRYLRSELLQTRGETADIRMQGAVGRLAGCIALSAAGRVSSGHSSSSGKILLVRPLEQGGMFVCVQGDPP